LGVKVNHLSSKSGAYFCFLIESGAKLIYYKRSAENYAHVSICCSYVTFGLIMM